MTILVINYGKHSCENISNMLNFLKTSFEVVNWKKSMSLSPQERQKFSHVVLSGGAHHVTNKNFPNVPSWIIEDKVKILAICYGMQIIADFFGGTVSNRVALQKGIKWIFPRSHMRRPFQAWMNRYDFVSKVPLNFNAFEFDYESGEVAAMIDNERKICAFQYHPESWRQERIEIFQDFLVPHVWPTNNLF